MRPRFLIYLSIFILIVIGVMFWLRPKQSPPVSEQLKKGAQSNGQLANSTEAATTNKPTSKSPTVVLPTASTQSFNPLTALGEFQKYIDSQNKPVDFYGQVIDQNTNPIPNVKIGISIRHWTMPDPAVLQAGTKEIYMERTSDAGGRFEFHDESGDGIDIESIQKDGYELSSKAPNHVGPETGTYENPMIFSMWKMGEKAQLVAGSKFLGIIPDGRIYTIDFLQQTKMESSDAQGDIRISIVRPTQIQPRTRFDWSFSIQAVNGGLIRTADDFMYEAPESGYQQGYQFTMSATNSDWKRELDSLRFYLKSRGGQVYGRFVFDIIPDYNRVSVFNISWAVNPNGSRNLQP